MQKRFGVYGCIALSVPASQKQYGQSRARRKNLCNLWPTFFMAKKMGKELG